MKPSRLVPQNTEALIGQPAWLLRFRGALPTIEIERPLVHLTVVLWTMRGGIVIGALLGMLALMIVGRWLLIGGDGGTVTRR